MCHCSQRGGETRGPRADDEEIEHVAARLAAGTDRLDRLATLLERITDESHAAELARYEYAGHRRLEARGEQGNVHATPLGAEYERDGRHGARGLAGAVAYAVTGIDELGATPHDAEDRVVLLLRAGFDARCATDTTLVDVRVQRSRLAAAGLLMDLLAAALQPAAALHVPYQQE